MRWKCSLAVIVLAMLAQSKAMAQSAVAPDEATASTPPEAAPTPQQAAPALPAESPDAPATPPAASPVPPETAPPPAAPSAPPAPYSLPWQLRPAQPGNALRADTALAFSDPRNTVASTLLFSMKVTDSLAPLVRLGFVTNSPDTGPSGTSIENPVLGGLYGVKLTPELKLGLFLGLALPFGQGGGTPPDPSKAAAVQSGILARSAMDNAMFAVNYFTVFPGIDIAWVKSGFTLQGEATLLRLTRTRGPSTQDSGNTNLTLGVHAGYFIVPMLSIGAELRHQRWLSTPTAVRNDTTGVFRDNTTVAMGPRVHIDLGNKRWLRPGIAYIAPIDKPMTTANYKIVFIDVPFTF